tara:strand:+ start:17152 stop:17826 length:675 start_codon:yes stop_codon:yes gene_type:complete
MSESLLITICSKDPSGELIENINNLQTVFNEYDKKICIIDSGSTILNIYEEISEKFPLVEIHFLNNKNYEYGAYKHAYHKYPDYDIYCCIQDTFLIVNDINISEIDDKTVFTYESRTGFKWCNDAHRQEIEKLLINVDIGEYKLWWCSNFNLATHNSFICNNYAINNIFETLTNPPVNKCGSVCYERILGLYFFLKKYKVISINDNVVKINGNRESNYLNIKIQ